MKTPVIEGSSKRFYTHDDSKLLMTFKDCLHGASRVGEIDGTGYLRQAFSYYFFRLLEKENIATHLTEDIMLPQGILVKAVEPVKIEIIVRNVSRGHWVDSHKIPLFAGGEAFTPPLVEFCLKWKTTLENGQVVDDPRISPELAIQLNSKAKDPSFRDRLLRNMDEFETLKQLALSINAIYTELLSEVGWTLEDFKFEVGFACGDASRQFLIIDEISPDCSRIRDAKGSSLTKDLFRQRRPEGEIYQGYLALKERVEKKYAEKN
jgi:phosphoribosylaminoimidazole-succinocarboxamide synthase